MTREGLWHWLDDVELTAFADDFGRAIVLVWPHTKKPVLAGELSRGDHVLFDYAGNVLAIRRPRQAKIGFQRMLTDDRAYLKLPKLRRRRK